MLALHHFSGGCSPSEFEKQQLLALVTLWKLFYNSLRERSLQGPNYLHLTLVLV
jgi:hypothetical protein